MVGSRSLRCKGRDSTDLPLEGLDPVCPSLKLGRHARLACRSGCLELSDLLDEGIEGEEVLLDGPLGGSKVATEEFEGGLRGQGRWEVVRSNKPE